MMPDHLDAPPELMLAEPLTDKDKIMLGALMLRRWVNLFSGRYDRTSINIEVSASLEILRILER